MNYSRRSWQELWVGIASVEIWLRLSLVDVVARYRRTMLGPLWHVLSHAATIVGLSLLYSRIMHQEARSYLQYVTAGLTVWSLMVMPLADGAGILVRSKPLIMAYDMPISLHVMRAVSGYFITFLHNMIVYVVVALLTGLSLNLSSLLFFPAIMVILVASTGLSMILSVYGARYRDLTPAVSMVTSIAFLLTPIFWNKAQSLGIEWITTANPLYHFLQIARAPLLGQAAAPLDWTVSIVLAGMLFLLGTLSIVSNRSNVPYWV